MSTARIIEDWLGTEVGSGLRTIAAVERGLPLRIITSFLQHGLSRREIAQIIIPERTLKHRRSRKQALSAEESDRALRAARILARAESVFEDRESALRWMRSAKRRFGSRTPLEMMATEAGGRLVEEMLIQTEEGMFA